jgi:hypothetical protein
MKSKDNEKVQYLSRPLRDLSDIQSSTLNVLESLIPKDQKYTRKTHKDGWSLYLGCCLYRYLKLIVDFVIMINK